MSNACLQFSCPGNKDLSVQRLPDSRRNKMLSGKKRARVVPSSLHPCFKMKQCFPKELAAGPWQVAETALQLHKRRKPKLSALGSSVIILPTTSPKTRDCHINQPSWFPENHRLLLPFAIPIFAPVASRLTDTQPLTVSPRLLVHSQCVHSPLVDLPAVAATESGGAQAERLGRVGAGEGMEGQVLQKEGLAMCILHLKGLGRN